MNTCLHHQVICCAHNMPRSVAVSASVTVAGGGRSAQYRLWSYGARNFGTQSAVPVRLSILSTAPPASATNVLSSGNILDSGTVQWASTPLINEGQKVWVNVDIGTNAMMSQLTVLKVA